MPRVLITGMSGAGKSTVLAALARRGHLTVDTDYDGWTSPAGLWDEQRMSELLESHADVVVSGTVDNQVRFYDRFEHVVLLSAPIDTLMDRLMTRANNPYGRSEQERAEARRYVGEVEPLLRRSATVELDGRRPVEQLADAIESLGSADASRDDDDASP